MFGFGKLVLRVLDKIDGPVRLCGGGGTVEIGFQLLLGVLFRGILRSRHTAPLIFKFYHTSQMT